jgi:hypothetical protein
MNEWVWIGRARVGTRQLDARAHATMDAQLNALAKAQDALRNAVSVGLGEMRTAYEGVARESATEAKGRASEREAASTSTKCKVNWLCLAYTTPSYRCTPSTGPPETSRRTSFWFAETPIGWKVS